MALVTHLVLLAQRVSFKVILGGHSVPYVMQVRLVVVRGLHHVIHVPLVNFRQPQAHLLVIPVALESSATKVRRTAPTVHLEPLEILLEKASVMNVLAVGFNQRPASLLAVHVIPVLLARQVLQFVRAASQVLLALLKKHLSAPTVLRGPFKRILVVPRVASVPLELKALRAQPYVTTALQGR